MSLSGILSQRRIVLSLISYYLLLSASVNSLPQIGKTNVDPQFLTPVERELLRRSKAADIKSWLDTTVEPCNNFYDFVCGNWHRINAGDSNDDTKGPGPARGITKRVKDFLNAPKLRILGSPENKIQNFYESCRNIAKNTCVYEAALRQMSEEFGQFSYLKKKGGGERRHLAFNWWRTIAKISSYYGKSFIISAIVDYDLKDKNKAAIYLGEPAKVLKSSNKLEKLRNHYSATVEQAQRVARNVEQFEGALAQAASDFPKLLHSPAEEYTLYNMSDVQELLQGFFNLESFLMISFNTTNLPQQIYVQNNKYFENLAVMFKEINLDTVEDYILLGLLEEFQVVHETDHMDGLCSFNTRKYFMKYMEHVVYQQFRSAEFEKDLYELWHEIKAVFLAELQGERYLWMSKATRDHAIRKLKNITFRINSYDDEKFDEYFKDLHIDPLNYVANTQNILRHTQLRKGNKLHISSTDAFLEKNLYVPVYYSRLNQFRMPVATLQPFQTWHAAYPHAIKYAHLGYLLAHEMLRAFDDYHRHLDAEGNANNWWDGVAANEYEVRRRCFQAQYHNYTQDGHPLADTVWQGENIADNAAVKIAYLAYTRWVEWAEEWGADINVNETFANLPYSHKELFFMSYGQQWCSDVRDNFAKNSKSIDGSVPGRFRVIGPLSNFPLFSQVFKCYAKAPMNPSKKCEIF